jgi:uroporphyrin-3 C-methyltransferase
MMTEKSHVNASGSLAITLSVIAMLGISALSLGAFYSYQHFRQWQSEVTVKLNEKPILPAYVEKQDLQLLQQKLETLSQTQQQANQSTSSLIEVSYLVYMANERLLVAKDVSAALTQLKLAQDRLSRMSQPSLMPLKAAIANDINQLSQVPAIDKQAFWLEIGSLSDLMNTLTLKELGQPAESTTLSTLNFDTWRTALQSSWDQFKSLIRVTRIEENPIPLTGLYEEQMQLKMALQLWILQT